MEPKANILVVDDNPDKLSLLEAALCLAGYRVTTATDGDEALAAIESYQPDLIITDVMMPRMNGYELARRLRSEQGLEHCTIVALTGYSQDGDRQQAQAAGFDHYLVKPVSIEALEDLLASLPSSPPPTVKPLGKRA